MRQFFLRAALVCMACVASVSLVWGDVCTTTPSVAQIPLPVSGVCPSGSYLDNDLIHCSAPNGITPIIVGSATRIAGFNGNPCQTTAGSAAAAIDGLLSCLGQQHTLYSCNEIGCTWCSGSGTCTTPDQTTNTSGGGTTFCPAGFSPYGSTQCKADSAAVMDSNIATAGGTVVRNADGNITSFKIDSLNNYGTYSVTSFDSLKRPTQIVPPSGNTVSFTYVGNSAQVATRTDLNGTVTYGWLDASHVSSVTLPDGSRYDIGYRTDANGTKHVNSVGVVNGVVGGVRAGTLAPWGVAIPYVTASLKTPDDKTLAMLLQGLELPDDVFHAEPVGLQPYASMNPAFTQFFIGYSDTYTHAMDAASFPPVMPGMVMPSDSTCNRLAGAGGNQHPWCIDIHQALLHQCNAIDMSTPSGVTKYFACIEDIYNIMRNFGC